MNEIVNTDKSIISDRELLKALVNEDENSLSDAIYDIAYFHGEAAFLRAMMELNDKEDNSFLLRKLRNEGEHENAESLKLSKELDELAGYEEASVYVRSLILYEYEQYYEKREQIESSEYERKIEQLWRGSQEETFQVDNGRYIYPIRKKIEYAFTVFMQNVLENEALYAEDPAGEFRILVDRARIIANNGNRISWYTLIRLMEDTLSDFRQNHKGSFGHLLWIILYLSEYIYFVSRGHEYGQDISREEIKRRQPEKYWNDQLRIDENLLDELVGEFILKQRTNLYQLDLSMNMLVYSRDSGIEAHRREYKRVKSIFHRDSKLRGDFIDVIPTDDGGDKSGSGKNGGRRSKGTGCFAILTNSKRDHFLAISGFSKARNTLANYNAMKNIFMSKCIGHIKYQFIDIHDYDKSLYLWMDPAIKELSEKATERKRFAKHIVPPCCYRRMFSCAERRLVDKYNSLPGKHNYIIVSKMKPCYMCKRVLDHHGIPCVYFEDYVMDDEKTIMNELDTFIKKL